MDNGVETKPPLVLETVLILGVSLGASAVSSVLRILDAVTRPEKLNELQVSMNISTTPDRPWLDLLNQVYNLTMPLFAAALACFLLLRLNRPAGGLRSIGMDFSHPWKDLGGSALLAAGIGIPGLLFYLFAVWIGINMNVSPANLAENWWTVPVYILLAVKNGLQEEIIMVGYLFTRWAQAGWRNWVIVLVSAVIRGSYHLYQGFGGFIGNVVMGVVFGLVFMKTKRVWVLVGAHALIDIVVFVGYPLVSPLVEWI
jgi:membrane protease YdiL (CAAX protease family)